MNKYFKYSIIVLMILVVGFVVGRFSSTKSNNDTNKEIKNISKSTKPIVWTCSMHPQIKLHKKGKCPICFMDLIPLSDSTNDDGERVLKMTHSAMKLADITTTKIGKKESFVELNLFGKITVDTTRISDIAILVDGEIRNLYVNYIGVPVKKGDHIAEVYSPDVVLAGEDYLIALESKPSDKELINTSLMKLKLLGVPTEYIQLIKKNRKVPITYTLKSPSSGYIKNLIGYKGMWVKKGQILCRVINMTSLWVELDVYEEDLAWIRYSQDVEIKAKAIYGTVFKGIVSYIPPDLNDKTRTVKIRVNVNNDRKLLKPNMFVSANLKVRVSASGYAISSKLKGKWISPMHPEIIKDEAGECDVCGMALVKAKDLGYVESINEEDPLLVPENSVLITGKRAVVYLKTNDSPPIFEGREIEIGPKTHNGYVVLSGLQIGDVVVNNGGFKIDSALQIQAKPSMMSVKGGESIIRRVIKTEKLESINNQNLRDSLEDFIDYYFEITKKLSNDQFVGLNTLAGSMLSEFEYVDYSTLKPNELKFWNSLQADIEKSIKQINRDKDIKSFRENFKKVSNKLIFLIDTVGHNKKIMHFAFCSMADAHWLQLTKSIQNPYYGSSMLKCGEIKKSKPKSIDKKQEK